MPTSLSEESTPLTSQSKVLNKLLFLHFPLLIMHGVLINTNLAHVLMMHHCALGVFEILQCITEDHQRNSLTFLGSKSEKGERKKTSHYITGGDTGFAWSSFLAAGSSSS